MLSNISRSGAKALPAVRRASSSTSQKVASAIPSRRAASTMAQAEESIPDIFDIFDAPARLENQYDYAPSFFRPPTSSTPFTPSTPVASSSTSATASASSSAPRTSSQYQTYAQPVALLFDGPARPRQRPVVTSRHRSASTASSSLSQTVAYVAPEPEVFDGPSKPRRRQHVPRQKADSSLTQNVAMLVAAAGVVGYTTYQSQRDTTQPPPEHELHPPFA